MLLGFLLLTFLFIPHSYLIPRLLFSQTHFLNYPFPLHSVYIYIFLAIPDLLPYRNMSRNPLLYTKFFFFLQIFITHNRPYTTFSIAFAHLKRYSSLFTSSVNLLQSTNFHLLGLGFFFCIYI